MMLRDDRRDFLRGSLAAAGWAVCGGAAGGLALAGTQESARTPTGRFRDAVIEGDIGFVRLALGQDPGLVHLRDEVGRSVFALALLHRHPEIADLLRERGHRPDLHESALALDWERLEELAQAAPGLLNQDHPVGGTAMVAAALGGAGSQIWRVYQYGGDPNVTPRGNEGYSAVRAALEFPDLETAEAAAAALLSNGAQPDLPQPGGSSALHAAATRGSTAVVEILIRKGADLDATDDQGRTALELAEHLGQRRTAELLRRQGEIPRDHTTSREAYDVEGRPYRAPDISGFSYALRGQVVGASHFKLDTVRELVGKYPSLVHSTATTTERAVEACAHTGQREIVDFLLERGAPYSLPTAVMRGDAGRARQLLEEDPLRIHERGAHDFALLWYPVIGKGLIELAELLVGYGADIERQHFLGTTALHFAARGGQLEMVDWLIEHGADVNRSGAKFGDNARTPLQAAQDRGHDDVAKLLRQRGARA